MMRIAVLGSGRGSNLHALLRHCAQGTVDAQVGLVVSDRPGAGILEIAREEGVPAVLTLPRRKGEPASAHDARLAQMLALERPDLVVLAGYMRILGPEVVGAFPDRIINIHPSLLPAYPGARGVRDALAGGARITGCTTHIVTAELDAGPLLLQAALAVRPGEKEERVARRVLALEHLLLPRTVQLFAQGRIEVQQGRAEIRPGDSWLHDPRIEPVAGALYSEGF